MIRNFKMSTVEKIEMAVKGAKAVAHFVGYARKIGKASVALVKMAKEGWNHIHKGKSETKAPSPELTRLASQNVVAIKSPRVQSR